MTGRTDDDIKEIRAGLAANADGLARSLLGEPSSRTGSEWRWGRNGSFSMVMRQGSKRGFWHDHEAGAGGDLFDLIERDRSGGFPAAVDYARAFLRMPEAKRPRPVIVTPAKAAAEDEDRNRIARAKHFAAEGVPIDGTVAETYLIHQRGIPRPAAGWPEAVRFCPSHRALMVLATDATGAINAVQLVHLTAEGTKRPHEQGLPTKQSFGVMAGAVVRLPGQTGPLLLAEGPETGLSVWAATGHETWIALGSVGKAEPPQGRRLVVCADDDQSDKPGAKALAKAVSRWRSERHNVLVVYPWPDRRFDKSDFNDLIRASGTEAVRGRIAAAITARPKGAARVSVAEAREHLATAVTEFFRQAKGFDPKADAENAPLPIVHGIRIGVGVGKSAIARFMAAKMLAEMAKTLAEMRGRGDRRTIVFAVPTHKLGDEQARDFEALPEARAVGLRAAVWRGREAPDPEAPGKTMCRDLEAVRDAQSVGAKVETSVCFQRGGGITPTICPFHSVCGTQRLKLVEADLWIVPHEMIFSEKPAALGNVAVMVVDEAAWQDGLQGASGPPEDLSTHALEAVVDVLPGDNTGHASARLREVYRVVSAALSSESDGPLRRNALRQYGLDCSTATDGRVLTWRRVIDPGLLPGMTAVERRERIRAVAENRTAIRLAKFFTALEALLTEDGPEASGWAALVTLQEDEGPVRALRLRGRRKIRKGWAVPTLILDALLDRRLVEPYWPQVQVTAEIEADTPHMHVRQMIGRDWAKSALVPDEYADEGEIQRRAKNSAHVRAAVLREARATGGKTLVVAQKAVEDQWRSTGAPLPASVDLAHHNAVAGRDEWGPGPGRDGVTGLIVVGRTLPRPGDVERMAEALTGRAIAERVTQYPKHEAPIEMRDGEAALSEAYRHPDPIAEAIRWQVCEGELLQIIGRGRGVNRTADNPLSVLILTNTPLPLPVDELVPWTALAPSPNDLMLSAGGVVLDCAADASRAYRDLWPTPEAARKAFQRTSAGHFPIDNYLMGNVPHWCRRATYQRAGERQRPAVLVYDPEIVPDLAEWLAARLGPLAQCDAPPASSEGEDAAPAPVTTAEIRPAAPEAMPIDAPAIYTTLHPPLPGEGTPALQPVRATSAGPVIVSTGTPPRAAAWPEPGSFEPEDAAVGPEPLPLPAEAPAPWEAELQRRLARYPRPKIWDDEGDDAKQLFWQLRQDSIRATWAIDWREAWQAGQRLPPAAEGT